jgi:uncharacterized LabA/DUF88 family protein
MSLIPPVATSAGTWRPPQGGLALCDDAVVKTNVYVDGFNLYFGCFKNPIHPRDRQFKWLNLDALMSLALPNDDIQRIKYFTAMVKNTQGDKGKETRQRVYVRALKTIPHLTVHEGRFLKTKKTGLLVTPQGVVTTMLRTVETREEKGSDVNLACHLLLDAFDNDFELAVVVSNDSDLAGAIDIVRHRFGKPVGVINPQSAFSGALNKSATFYREIRRSDFAMCQFPANMRDAKGSFHRPPSW